MYTGTPDVGSSSSSSDDKVAQVTGNQSSGTVRPVQAHVDDTPHNSIPQTSEQTYSIQEGTQSSPSRYRIEGKGLFVIMANICHNFEYQGNDFSEVDPLNYEPDIERLLQIFHLTEESENLILQRDVTPDFDEDMALDDEIPKMFTNFMVRVKEYGQKPSFVFFVLLSHGFSDGSFLLSAKRPCQCDDTRHSLSGVCVARNVDKEIIKPIQEWCNFNGVPKIIMLQFCRGQNTGTVKTGTKGPDGILIADDFIPEASDTLVFYACAEKHISWVLNPHLCSKNGSLFIQAFCDVAEETKEKLKTFLRDGLQNKKFWKKYQGEYELSPEKLLDGWVHNIFQKVSTRVSNQLLTIQATKHHEISPCDKQQPVFLCSLRHNLSFLDMIKPWENFLYPGYTEP